MNGKELIKKLTKFYKVEESGLPHYNDEIVDVAFALAFFIRSQAEEDDSGFWWDGNICKDSEMLERQMNELITNPSVTLIDTVVHHMHQGLLDAIDSSGESSEEMMWDYEGDIMSYLLNRN